MTIIKANFAEGGGMAWALESGGEVRKSGVISASEQDPLVAVKQLQLLSGAHNVHLTGAMLTDAERGYARVNNWKLV